MKLLYLHYKVRLYEWIQQKRVEKRYYNNERFRRLDQELISGPNPYKIPEAFPYGETPLCSLQQIADQLGLKPTDRVVDLGCGRGRGVFFLAHRYGCHVHGIDKINFFIDRAQTLKKKYQLPRVSFTCGDLRDFDFSQVNYVFFYGTTFDDDFITDLKIRMERLPPGSKIVTVSYAVVSGEGEADLAVSFPWGKGDVYIQEH